MNYTHLSLEKLFLTPYQNIFYNEWLLNPLRSDYNMVLDQVLEGELDIARLNDSLIRLVNEHLLLNSNVMDDGTKAYWRLRPQVYGTILTYYDQPLSAGEVLSLVKQPFDLGTEELFRFYAIRQDDRTYRLIYVLAHILIDGLSYAELLEAGSRYYNEPGYRQKLSLSEQSQLYGALSTSLEELLDTGREQMESFWSNHLKGTEEADLRFFRRMSYLVDDEESSSQASVFGEYRCNYPNSEINRVKTLGRKHGLTPYMFGQLVYAVLMHRLTGQHCVCVNYAAAILEGRDFIYGAHVNTLLINYRFEPDTCLGELVTDTLAYYRGLKTTKSRYLPIDRIVSHTGRRPVLDAGFIQTNLRDLPLSYEGVDHVLLKDELFLDLAGDLVFEQELGNCSLNYRIRYNNERIDPEQVTRFVLLYQRLFDAMLDDLLSDRMDKTISEYSLLGQEETALLLCEWNQTRQDYANGTIHSLFERQAKATPDSTAIIFGGTDLSYRELNERSNQLAHYLREIHQIGPNDLVALQLDRSEHMLIAILGVLKSGAAYVPLDPSYPGERKGYILDDTSANVLLTNEVYQENFPNIDTSVFAIDSPDGLAILVSYPRTNPRLVNVPQDLAYVIYTSGTTGKPKGVMVQHSGVVNLVDDLYVRYRFGVDEVVLQFSNYTFDASVEQIFLTLLKGHSLLVICDRSWEDQLGFVRMLIKCRVSHIDVTPSLLALLDLSEVKTIKRIVCGGERLDTVLLTSLRRNYPCMIVNAYGPTECSVTCIVNIEAHNTGIGRPISNTTCYVLDEHLRPVPVGAPGELYIGGAGVARGYLNNETLTGERFIANPFQMAGEKSEGYNGRLYRTGDLVRYLADGSLQYLGRNDFQVKLRGYRIEPGEIETVLNTYPGIRQSVVIGREHPVGNQYLAGYYVSEEEVSSVELRGHLGASLPDYMVPSVFVHLASMPLTLNGKLDRRALPEAGLPSCNSYTAPETELQRALCGIYGSVLGLSEDQIGIDDDFFGLGGNSIASIRLITRINNELNSNVSVSIVFGSRTVRKLSGCIAQGQEQALLIRPLAVSDEQEQLLSYAQQRLWFIERYTGGSAAYNIPMVVRLQPGVDVEKIIRSLEQVVSRHQVLRTLIKTSEDGIGYQQVGDDDLVITEHLVSSQTGLDELLIKESVHLFDLEHEYPVRVNLYQLNGETYLSVVLHHIAFDGWSTDVLLSEIISCYDQEPLPQLRFQYKDYALWQRGYLTGEVLEKQLSYWKSSLSGFETLNLLTDHARPSQLSYAGADVFFELEQATSFGLRELAKSLDVSLYSVLLSGYYLLLSAYSGQDDVVVGVPVANRHHGGTADLIGFFVNTLVLRGRRDKEQLVKDFIIQTGESVVLAQQHQDLPFERLLSELDVVADSSRHAIFQVMFGMQDFGGQHQDGAGRLFMPYPVAAGSPAKFDLTVMLDESGPALRGSFNYAVSLFEKQTIQGYINTYEQILKEMVRCDWQKIGELVYLGEEDYTQQVYSWNSTRAAYPDQETIHSLFEQQAASTPESIAVVYQEMRLSYRELNERSNQLAHYLREVHQVVADELICLQLDRSEHMLIAILGVLKSGGAYVPIDPSYPRERRDYMLADTRARVLLTNAVYQADFANSDTHVFAIDSPGSLEILKGYPNVNLAAVSGPQHLAYVIYTSGTTGKPKGVMVEHSGIVNVLDCINEAYDFEPSARITAYTSYCFDVSVSEFFISLLKGGELHMLSDDLRIDADKLSAYLLNSNIEYTYLPPVMLSNLPKVDYPSLKTIIYAGEPCDYQTGYYWSINKRLYNYYGPTEATIYSSGKRLYQGDVHLIGRPVANTSCYVLDQEQKLLPTGAVGELYIGGAGVARGYLNNETLTGERFIANPFQRADEKSEGYNGRLYRTGDLVRYLADGSLQYLGRNDFQVKLRGYRIEPGEIETVLNTYPGIKQSVVIIRQQAGGDHYLAGYYVSDDEIAYGVLHAYLDSLLPPYMVPHVFVFLKSLPLTVNGKLDRRALPQVELMSEAMYAAAETELEQRLCSVYADVLGLSWAQVGIDDDFLGLGGNSIGLIRLATRINKELHCSLSVSSMFSNRTVRALATYITNGQDQLASIVPVSVHCEQEQLLSYAQQRLWFIERYTKGSAAYNIPMIVRLQPGVDVQRVVQSFQQIVKRHEVLRTVIKISQEGIGYQQVLDKALQVRIQTVNSRDELGELLQSEASYLFDLENEYPIRVNLYELDSEFYLVLVVHHIAFDGWSTDVLLSELISGYDREELPPLAFQYRDYALWQRNYLTGKTLADQLLYWKTQLSGYETLNLISDKPRPPRFSYEGADLHFELDAALSARLRELGKSLDVSLYSVLLSGFYLLLSAYSSQDDIVVGTPIANRHHAGIADLIGFFVNTLVLRGRINHEQPVEEFIKETGNMVMMAQKHQDLPFEHLVDELRVAPDGSRHAIFQVLFGVQSFGRRQNEAVQTLFTSYGASDGYSPAKFDLNLMMDDSSEQLRGSLNYALSLFEEQTVRGYIDTYLQILEELTKGQSRSIKELAYLRKEEFEKQIYNWNQTVRDYPKGETIHSLFEQQASKTPHYTAVICRDIRLSYRELNERSNQLAHYLRKVHQIQPGDLIALQLNRSELILIAILAVMKAGGAHVPIDMAHPKDRRDFILHDTKAKVVLTNEIYQETFLDIPATIFSIDSRDSLVTLGQYPMVNPIAVNSPRDLTYVIYTSGTTGKPKGVMVQHDSFINLMHYFRQQYFREIANINTFSISGYAFDMWGPEYGLTLLSGGFIELSDSSFTSLDVSKYDFIQLTPSVLNAKYDQINFNKPEFRLFVGAEALPQDLLVKLLNDNLERVVNVYGPTETTVWSLDQVNTESLHDTNIGRPISNTTCYVLDAHQRPLPVGAVGELYIGGAGVARGYLNNDALTHERFIHNPFQTQEERVENYNERIYRTGDLVRYVANGSLQYLGRNDFQVKLRGYRIELGEIESVLGNHPDIQQSVVLAKRQENGNQYLACYYVADRQLSDYELIVYLGSLLPEYMVPQVFVNMETMPLTVNGKLDRRALPDLTFTGNAVYVAPEIGLETQLCSIYAEILGIPEEQVGTGDDFFALGGNSILAIKLVSRIQRNLSFKLGVADIFTSRTVKMLSGKIAELRSGGRLVIKLNSTILKRPLFMIHPALGGCEVYSSLAGKLDHQFVCYGVDSYNLYNDDKIDDLKDLANLYLNHIDNTLRESGDDTNSYTLLGWSLGGKIALEIAAILESRGVLDIKIYLLDTFLQLPEAAPEYWDEEVKYMIEKGKEIFCREKYYEQANAYMNAERRLAAQPVSYVLRHTDVVLFKAMMEVPKSKISYPIYSKCNDVDRVLSNVKQLKLINLWNANHSNILEDEEMLIDEILK